MENRKETARPTTGRSRFDAFRTLAKVAALTLLAIVATPKVEAQGPSGVIYVESNDPTGNAILAYSRAADGSLSPLAGSPFSTGGNGVGPSTSLGPYDSDQQIIANPEHTLLFAVNGGSNSIAVFNIAASGALTPVAGSPFPSGGPNPVSLGLSGNLLCVVNKDEDPGNPGSALPNYTTFRVLGDGKLVAIPNATVQDDNGSDPTQALVSPSGKLVFGADFLGGAIRSFAISSLGRLQPRAVMAPPASVFAGTGAPALPLGLATHPTLPLLYVGFVTINKVGVYRYNSAGALQFLTAVPLSGHGVCWLRLNKEATRLYASNTADPSVTVLDLSANPAQPVEIQTVDLDVVAGSGAGGYQLALDPTGAFLQVVTQAASPTSTAAANAIHVFSVAADGTLTEVESSPTLIPVPTTVRPQGMVAF